MAVRRILVLGGYGNFGKRIAESLCGIKDITIIIAGRNSKKAEKLCHELSLKGADAILQHAVLDIYNRIILLKFGSRIPVFRQESESALSLY